MERDEGVQHRAHCHECEQAGRYAAHLIAKVEQAYGQAAEDYGKVEPGEERSLIGEEDLFLGEVLVGLRRQVEEGGGEPLVQRELGERYACPGQIGGGVEKTLS